jgi:uncharacterized protein (DUF433 family)
MQPTVYEGRPINLYTYLDVAQAVAVQWLRTEGFSYAQIRSAISEAGDEYGAWPLVDAPLGIARESDKGDRGVLAQRKSGVYIDVGAGTGQFTLKPRFFFEVRDTLRSGGWIARQLKLKRLEVDPGRLGGLPTLKGRRWSVPQVAQIAADQEGRDLLRSDYGLATAEIRESVQWSQAVAQL